MFASASEPLFSQKLPQISPNKLLKQDSAGSNDSFVNSTGGFLKYEGKGVSTKHARVTSLANKQSAGLDKPNPVIHTGIKNFWRINTNVEFHFIEHSAYDAIEVIAYKAETEEEAVRLFLSFSQVLSKCSEEDILTRLNTRREDHIRKKIPIVGEELEVFARHAAVAQYILSRVAVDPLCVHANTPFAITIVPILGDEVDPESGKLDVEMDRPDSLSDTLIPRKKKTTLGEFNSVIVGLATDTKLLVTANERAQRLAEIARLSVDAFINAASSSVNNLAVYTVPRQRWIRAINRVMYDNYVTKYITPLLTSAPKTPQRHVTFNLPKIEERKREPKPSKPVVSNAHTRKTVLS